MLKGVKQQCKRERSIRQVDFARIIYKWLLSGEWFSYKDVMEEALGDELATSLSKCGSYKGLKRAFQKVRNKMRRGVGEDCIDSRGNNRTKEFRYIGKESDSLVNLRNARAIKDLQRYWQFCQDSAGFFPTIWIEYFLKDSVDLLEIKDKTQKGEQIIDAGLNQRLKNIDMLPMLYEHIQHRKVLSVNYQPYGKDELTMTIHPHFLKEYNGRWYLFGYVDGKVYNLAIDRMTAEPIEVPDAEYIPAPMGFYADYFRDIVGATNKEENEAIDVYVRAHTSYMYGLMETKPIHTSQEVYTPFGQHKDGEYGEFKMHVKLNEEFIGRILQMSGDLEIVAPKEFRSFIKEKISRMAERYC